MSKLLRAPRYADGASHTLIWAICDILPYMSFQSAQEWYWEYLPRLTPQETALLGCNDRYFLLTGLLNRVDAIHPWIYERCREVEAEPDGHLDLWARFHYKSTIITFAGTIQEVLIDPEIRVCIFANDNEIAQPFLRQIKDELETNEELKRLYPDVLYTNPTKEAPMWSVGDGIVVKRKGNPREATVEAHGVINALPTGKHFPLQVYDDIITEDNVTNPDQVKKAIERTQLSFALGVGAGTRRRFAGTRYSYADPYEYFIDKKTVKPRIYPATEDGTMNGQAVFMGQAAWVELRDDLGQALAAAQMLQNPAAAHENTFRVAWLKSYMIRPRVMNVYILCDPSGGKHKSSDRTAMAVVGIDTLLNKYLLDGFCHRMPLSERWQRLSDLHRKWHKHRGVQIVRVGYERYGMQSDLEYFEEKMREPRTQSFMIEEVNWVGGAGPESRQGKQSKRQRIGRLEPDFRKGHFLIPRKVWHPDIETAVWHVTIDKDEEGRDQPDTAKIVYTPYKETGEERKIKQNEPWRIIEPIKRLDEEGHIYDLVAHFIEEYRLDPFAPHDDFLDGLNRVYDLEPAPAVLYEEVSVLDYPDA